jgi:hypothetical protein
VHRQLTRFALAVVAATFAVGVHLAAPGPTVACSCMPLQPMAAYVSDGDAAIFTGTPQAMEANGVPVLVTRWFHGRGGAAIVLLARDGFTGDGASCGTNPPQPGAEWIFVAYTHEGGPLNVNLCSPHAMLSGPQGQEMLADAIATFGEGVTPGPDDGGGGTGDGAIPTDLLGLVILGVVVVGGVLLWNSRPRRDDSTTG